MNHRCGARTRARQRRPAHWARHLLIRSHAARDPCCHTRLVKVMTALGSGGVVCSHLIIADGALGRNLRHHIVTNRMALAGSRTSHPKRLARLSVRLVLCAFGFGCRRVLLTVQPALKSANMHGAEMLIKHCIVCAPVSVAQSPFALGARRNIPRRKVPNRQICVQRNLKVTAELVRHKSAHARQLGEESLGPKNPVVLHCSAFYNLYFFFFYGCIHNILFFNSVERPCEIIYSVPSDATLRCIFKVCAQELSMPNRLLQFVPDDCFFRRLGGTNYRSNHLSFL